MKQEFEEIKAAHPDLVAIKNMDVVLHRNVTFLTAPSDETLENILFLDGKRRFSRHSSHSGVLPRDASRSHVRLGSVTDMEMPALLGVPHGIRSLGGHGELRLPTRLEAAGFANQDVIDSDAQTSGFQERSGAALLLMARARDPHEKR